MPPPNAWDTLRSNATVDQVRDGVSGNVAAYGGHASRRSRRYTWMLNGWMTSTVLPPGIGGTEFVTIGVPDDFLAVRVGFANINPSPWAVRKVIACASSSWNDYFTPTEGEDTPRPASAWSTLTFGNDGRDCSSLVTDHGAPTEIIVAGNAADRASGEATNPTWTFTDWVPCTSAGADAATGMRVLMLRALIPDGQTVTFANGLMTEYAVTPAINRGYRYFIGGLRRGIDTVTDPDSISRFNMNPEALRGNHLVNGQMMCLVQALTRNSGIVGMVCGDSHQAGTASSAQINNFLVQCMVGIGQDTIGTIPAGVVNVATGGATSSQFFPRMVALLDAVRPEFVVLPAWSFNEHDGQQQAGANAQNILFARMLLAAGQVREAGAVPIFMTPLPRDPRSMTAAVVKVWLDQRDAVLALGTSGEFVLDATPVLGAMADGVFTGAYRDGMSLDSIHPNDAGHAAIARALTPIVRQISGLSPRKPPPLQLAVPKVDKSVPPIASPTSSGGGISRFLAKLSRRGP